MALQRNRRLAIRPTSYIKLCLRLAFVILSVVTCTQRAGADLSTSTNSTTASTWDDLSASIRSPFKAQSKVQSRFEYSGEIFVDTSQTLSNPGHETWEGFYKANLKLTDNQTQITYGVESAYSQEYTYQLDDGSDGDMAYAVVFATKSWSNGKDFLSPLFDKITLGMTGSLPVGKESQRRTFEGGLGTNTGVSKKIGRWSLSEGLSYTRGFYQDDIRDNGTMNNPDIYKSKSSIGFDITKKLSASFLYIYTVAVDFYGVGKGADTSYIELDYALMKRVTLSAGVATDRASTLDPDGQTEQMKFYEPESSAAYFDVAFDF